MVLQGFATVALPTRGATILSVGPPLHHLWQFGHQQLSRLVSDIVSDIIVSSKCLIHQGNTRRIFVRGRHIRFDIINYDMIGSESGDY